MAGTGRVPLSAPDEDIKFSYDYLDSYLKFATDRDRDEYIDCLKISDRTTCANMYHHNQTHQSPSATTAVPSFKSWWLANNGLGRYPTPCSHWNRKVGEDNLRTELSALGLLLPALLLFSRRSAGLRMVSDFVTVARTRPLSKTVRIGGLGTLIVATFATCKLR